MDERDERARPADLEPLHPNVDGGAFRRPPILPIVGVLALVFGIAIGFGLAPKPGAASTAASTTPAAITLPEPASAGASGLGDAGFTIVWGGDGNQITYHWATSTQSPVGVSLGQAITAARKAWGIDETLIQSARVTGGDGSYTYADGSPRWVWEIVVGNGSDQRCASGALSSPGDARAAVCQAFTVVTIDYLTGEPIADSDFATP